MSFTLPGTLNPEHGLEGVYYFRRKAFDEVIDWVDPKGNSYVSDVLGLELVLQRMLGMSQADTQKLVDILWNFRLVSYDTNTGLYARVPHAGKVEKELYV